MTIRSPAQPILVTGATGYVGGCLLRRLVGDGRSVRCLTRRPDALVPRAGPGVEIAAGDLLTPATVGPAMMGVQAAYYLVHSMAAPAGFEELDRIAAANFARSARAAGVRHIIYLSGLGAGQDLSPHLASRHEVGRILRSSGVVTTELRASIVIGAGSASFETVRAIVESLPAIPAPKGMNTAAQPIAIEDLIDYLVAALDAPPRSAIFEIGGDDQVTYAEVLREYARQRKLRRRVLPMPAQALRASRILLAAVTPAHAQVAGAMVDSLRNATVVHDPAAREVFGVAPLGLSEAIERALASEERELVDASWGDIVPSQPARWGGTAVSRRLVTSQVEHVSAPPDEVFAQIQRIGGATGWYAADWFWRVRGLVDRARGGPGLRRGRRDPHDIRAGDAIDFWRVVRVEPRRRLLLSAEMKLPGRLWLQFDVAERGARTELRQTTVFNPAGYAGLAYWYVLYPVHAAVFTAMRRGLRRVTEHGHHVGDVPASPPACHLPTL